MALIDSLRAYYKFNSGALTTDETGNGYTLTNKNTVAETASGKIGYGADNGTATNKGFFRQPTPISYAEVASGFTFNFWLKNNDTSIDCIPFRYNVNNGSLERNFSFYFPQVSTPRVYCSFFDGAGHEIAYNTTITQGAWYMVTLTNDGTTIRLYINGVDVGNVSFTWSGYSRNTMNAFTIGMYMDVSTDTPSLGMKGVYDEVGVWARGLSAGEVSSLYNGGNGLTYPFSTTNPGAAFLFTMI